MASSTRPVALVTGASSGIGAHSRELANDGPDVVLVARRREVPALSSRFTPSAVLLPIAANLSRRGSAKTNLD